MVAFDPGWREVAVSEWAGGELRSYDSMPRLNKDFGIYLGKLGELVKSAAILVIEDQYAGISGILHSSLPIFKKSMLIGSRMRSLMKVCEVKGEIIHAGVLADCEIHEVLASSWQSIFKNKSILEALEISILSKNTKEASKAVAKKIAREVIRNHNIADAICLGYKWHYDQGIICPG